MHARGLWGGEDQGGKKVKEMDAGAGSNRRVSVLAGFSAVDLGRNRGTGGDGQWGRGSAAGRRCAGGREAADRPYF